MRRFAMRGLVVSGLMAMLCAAAALRGASAAKPKGGAPSISVIGFGVNQLFVPKGATVKSEAMCAEMVGSDSAVGPPQQLYLTVYVRSEGIPKAAPTQIKDDLPLPDEEFASSTLTDPAPFSHVFAGGILPGAAVPLGSAKGLAHYLIVSANSATGPSAEEFDGEYSFTASVKTGGRTLRSTAKVKVDCPLLR